MGKAAFALGIGGSLVLALLLGSRITRHDYTGTVVGKHGTHPTCPTIWVNWDQPLQEVPDSFVKCGCAEPPAVDPAGVAVHPPKQVVDTATPQDVLVLSFVDYTSLGGTRTVGESYDIRRGMYKETLEISPPAAVYRAVAMTSAIPAVAGIVLGVLLGLIPSRKPSGV